MNKKITVKSKNPKLLKEKQDLLNEYSSLEKEKNNVETVLACQIRKSEIETRQNEIIEQVYEIDGKLLKESEEFRGKIREEEIKGQSSLIKSSMIKKSWK